MMLRTQENLPEAQTEEAAEEKRGGGGGAGGELLTGLSLQ